MSDSPSPISPLNDLGVLVTRPEQQAHQLSRLIEDAGGRAIRVPLLKIVPSQQITQATVLLAHLDQYNWIIFISSNAVRYAQLAINGRINIPDNIRVAAIGRSTATALSKMGISVDLIPAMPYNSEALLACSQMHNIVGQACIIVRGEGGRELLGKALQQRGCSVVYAEVYKRVQPNIHPPALKRLWKHNIIDIITITSGEALKNLMTLLGDEALTLLVETPAIVISQRLESLARSMGLTRILLAETAADRSILKAINDFQLHK